MTSFSFNVFPYGFCNILLWQVPDNVSIAAMVLAGSMIMEGRHIFLWKIKLKICTLCLTIDAHECMISGVSLLVALNAVRKGAAAEGMTMWDYCWRGHDPTAVAVMMEVGGGK